MATISRFNGLNNVSDPLRLGVKWLVQADNVNVTNTGALTKREGYAVAKLGEFTSAFNTFDFQHVYTAKGGKVCDFDGVEIYDLTSTDPLYWSETNNQVFFNNGVDSGIILPDNTVIPWRWVLPNRPTLRAFTGDLPTGVYQVCCTSVLSDGRETGATEAVSIVLQEDQALQIDDLTPGCNVYVTPANSEVFQLRGMATGVATTFNASPDTLGRDLLNPFLDPLPFGADVIQFWKGRLYAAQPMPAEDQTAIWFSEPLGFHLFNLNSNFILVPGRVFMLAAVDTSLIIGTDARIYAYDGQKLDMLAEYGVVPGQHASRDGETVYFWTTRGVCSALPFTNLTEKSVSVAPGVRAGGCVVRSGGQKRYLSVIQQGGSAFNPYP